MRIDSASIGMESERTYSQSTTRVRKYSVSVNANEMFSATGAFSDMLGVSVSGSVSGEMSFHEQMQKLREECINLLLRLLFPDRETNLSKEGVRFFGKTSSGQEDFTSGLVQIGVRNEYIYEEYEETSFEAKGIVRCKDGREIDFNISLNMSRSFNAYYSEEINYLEAALTDPLVINYDGEITEFANQTISFDIDSDGVEDQINRLVEGSGFLALDLNEDGIINNGSELFGAKTGNGFKELSQYDSDKDGFIDEDDEIFDKLRIMTIDENGIQHLYSLKEKNVGAIGLGSSSTNFSVNELEGNETKAVIRRTGMFLFENGGVGTVHQVDMARRRQMAEAYA